MLDLHSSLLIKQSSYINLTVIISLCPKQANDFIDLSFICVYRIPDWPAWKTRRNIFGAQKPAWCVFFMSRLRCWFRLWEWNSINWSASAGRLNLFIDRYSPSSSRYSICFLWIPSDTYLRITHKLLSLALSAAYWGRLRAHWRWGRCTCRCSILCRYFHKLYFSCWSLSCCRMS